MINIKKFEANCKKNIFDSNIHEKARKYSLKKTDAFVTWWNQTNYKCHILLLQNDPNIAMKLMYYLPNKRLNYKLNYDIKHVLDQFTSRTQRILPAAMMLEYLPVECIWHETMNFSESKQKKVVKACRDLQNTLLTTTKGTFLLKNGDIYDENNMHCGMIQKITITQKNVLLLITGVGILCGLPPYAGKLIYNSHDENVLSDCVTLSLNFSEFRFSECVAALRLYLIDLKDHYVFVRITKYDEKMVHILMRDFNFIPIFKRHQVNSEGFLLSDCDCVTSIPEFEHLMLFRPKT